MIKLFTDSASYIPLDLQVEHNINILQHTFVIDGKEYKENEINYEHFYKDVDKKKVIPDTVPISVDYLYSVFEDEIIKGNAIVAVFLSSKYNPFYENAAAAAKQLKVPYPKADIIIIDSKSSSMEQGFAVLAAAEKIKLNASLEDVVNAARDAKRSTRALVIPEKLKYLEYDGKIKKSEAFMADVMHVTPILTSHNGTLGLEERNFTQQRAIAKSIEIFKKDMQVHGIKTAVVQHVNAFEAAMNLAEKVKQTTEAEVFVSEIGPVIGARFGPNTLGLVYMTKNEITS